MEVFVKYKHSLRLYSFANFVKKFSSNSGTSAPRKGLILGVYSGNGDNKSIQLTPTAEKYNLACEGRLLKHIQLAGNEVKPGKSLVFWGLEEKYNSVAVVGLKNQCDTEDDTENICHEREAVRNAVAAGCKALEAAGIKDIYVDDCGDAEAAAEASLLSTWKFQEYKSKKEDLPKVNIHGTESDLVSKWQRGYIKAEAQNLARRLADTPSNLMTPCIFANVAQEVLTPLGYKVQVHDEQWADEQKMYAFLGVAKGSDEPPKFLEITYNKGEGSPLCLVGKGVTFDSGGISLKPGANMDHMRADMAGAASVAATLYGIAKLGVNANIKAIIPLVENMPSGKALKPGDIIRAHNGKSICVDNTDAEGRLILADALSYSSNFNPKWILDIATLTGAMMVALGSGATGVFTNSNKLYQTLESAGSTTGDRVWRMPLWKHYTKQIAENPAYDLNNIGKGRGGGSCTAAAFLKEFVPKKTDWLHLDIAGVMGPEPDSSMPYLTKGMSGRPTRTLIEFIESQC